MTAQLDITEQELAIVQGILQSILPNNSRVWVFGSRAKHTTRHNSDLDLAIEASSALNKTTLMQLASAFEDSHLPYTVDIVDLQQVEAYFKDIIDEQKVSFPLWGKVPELRFPEFGEKYEIKRLDEATSWSSGGTPSKENLSYWNGDIPWISASSMHFDQVSTSDLMISKEGLKSGSRLALKGTILILVRGSMLFNRIPICVATADVSFNQDVKAIKSDPALFSDYLFYWLKSKEHKLLSMVVGTGIGAGKLETSDLKSLKLYLPEVKEQQKIASFLTSIDDKLTKLRRKREMLEQYKRGLMQQLFSQTIRFKQGDGSAFPEWKDTVLEKVANVVGGGTPDTFFDDYWGGEIQWFTPSEIKSKYLLSSKRTISDKGLKASSAKLLPKGSLLLSTRATVGDVGIALRESTTNQGFQSLIIKPDNSNEFWYYWLKSNKKTLLRKSSGSTFLEIGKREVVKLAVKKPIFSEQQKIADCLSSFDAKIDAVAKQIQQLDTFKKGLLQKMFV